MVLMNTQKAYFHVLLLPLAVVGCTSGEKSKVCNPARIASPALTTHRVTWNDWAAVEQTNGIMTLRHVPAVGGRTLSLEINGDDAFLVVDEHRGQTYDADSLENSVHFGGHFVCIGPELRWSVDEQPFNTNAGPYDVQVESSDASQHTILLTSRHASWRGATISMQRSITMHRGSTHVAIEEQVINRGDKPLEVYLWDFTQLDAHRDDPKNGKTRRNLVVYMPVPLGENGEKQYTSLLPPDSAMEAQIDEGSAASMLRLNYQGVPFKVASHPEAWWVAAVDRDTGWTYVKQFEASEDPTYVDNNGPVEVFGSGEDHPLGMFVELELLTGMNRYAPGEGIVQRANWYATTCAGPVLSVKPAGVVCSPLRAYRDDGHDGDEEWEVRGRFGVFHLGTAQLVAYDQSNEPVASVETFDIDPREELIIKVDIDDDRLLDKRLKLQIFDHNGDPVGTLEETFLSYE